jgi:mono/diheme cytochrome c family protein
MVVVIGASSYLGQYGYPYSQQGYGSMMGGMGRNMMGSGMMGGGMMGSGMMGNGIMGGEYDKDSFSSNGERIYYTGIDSTSRRIGFEGGPVWFYMHGGSCVNCHGTSGKGGVPITMSTAIPADLTNLYATHTHGDEKMVPYNDDLLKRAITKGIDANGKRLDPTMPRWYMPEKDFNDLVAYIKTLQSQDHSRDSSTGEHPHNGNVDEESHADNHKEDAHGHEQANAPSGNPSKSFLAAVVSVILGSFFLVQYLKLRM